MLYFCTENILTRNKIKQIISDGLSRPIVILLRKTKITTNHLTIIGVIISAISATLISQNLMIYGGLILLLSGFFDLLDGEMARTNKQTSKSGALLDSICDRIGEILIFIGILIYFHSKNYGMVHHLFILTSVASSGLVSYARSKAESLNINCTTGIMTRGERIVVLVIAILLEAFFPNSIFYSLILITSLSIITFTQRISLISSNLKNNR